MSVGGTAGYCESLVSRCESASTAMTIVGHQMRCNEVKPLVAAHALVVKDDAGRGQRQLKPPQPCLSGTTEEVIEGPGDLVGDAQGKPQIAHRRSLRTEIQPLPIGAETWSRYLTDVLSGQLHYR